MPQGEGPPQAGAPSPGLARASEVVALLATTSGLSLFLYAVVAARQWTWESLLFCLVAGSACPVPRATPPSQLSRALMWIDLVLGVLTMAIGLRLRHAGLGRYVFLGLALALSACASWAETQRAKRGKNFAWGLVLGAASLASLCLWLRFTLHPG